MSVSNEESIHSTSLPRSSVSFPAISANTRTVYAPVIPTVGSYHSMWVIIRSMGRSNETLFHIFEVEAYWVEMIIRVIRSTTVVCCMSALHIGYGIQFTPRADRRREGGGVDVLGSSRKKREPPGVGDIGLPVDSPVSLRLGPGRAELGCLG